MELPLTPYVIFEFYDTPYYESDFLPNTDLEKLENIDMDSVIKYLSQDRGSWNNRLDTRLPTNFNQAIVFPVAKMWLQFIGKRIAPALNVSNINVFRVVLLYSILKHK